MNTNLPNVIHTSTVHGVRHFNQYIFKLPEPVVTEYFSQYYLLYWSGAYIKAHIENLAGCIHRNGVLFQIVYKPPLTRGKIFARLQDQFALSFRVPKMKYGLKPVVIIAFTDRKNQS